MTASRLPYKEVFAAAYRAQRAEDQADPHAEAPKPIVT
jgi:hypothetical protein